MLPYNFRFHLFVWFWVIVSFILLTSVIILKTSGLIVNFKSKTIEKTALVVIDSFPDNSLVYLEEKLIGKTPYKINYLSPGLYHLRISKEGYHDWEKTIKVGGGEYVKLTVVLFLKNPETKAVLSVDDKLLFKTEEATLNNNLADKIPSDVKDLSWDKNKTMLLYRTDNEIWLFFPNKKGIEQQKIVARFSQQIKKVKFYPDSQHILFVMDGKLRIIEIDGTNNIELIDLPSEEFMVSSSGREIYYSINNETRVVRIR